MRTIESPGVEIREIDLSQITQLPVGTSVLAIGYANQGPTDELINVTSQSELEAIYGEPTNSAERYFFETCKQILAANGTLLTTRLPYGSGAGDGFTSNYSALMFPVYPYDQQNTTATVNVSTGTQYANAADGEFSTTVANGMTGILFGGVFGFYQTLSAENYVGFDPSTLKLYLTAEVNDATTDEVTFTWNTSSDTFSSSNSEYAATWTLLDNDYDQYKWRITKTGEGLTGSNGVLTLAADISSATAYTLPTLRNAENYYFGQPVHTVINETTYYQWQQGAINWKNQIPQNMTITDFANSSAAQYAGFIVVNELKSAISDRFEGYYLAIADNSKTDRGSDFDVTQTVKTFNDITTDDEWLTLNESRLAFSLSGTYEENEGSISEVVETLPGYDFSRSGAGGFDDSLILAQFKVRRSIYNSDESILDFVLGESYIGSLDSTRVINNPNGGRPNNFYLEQLVNDNSSSMKMFVNPNISVYGQPWQDSQTGKQLKKVRVMADERANTDSTVATDPAEPHGKAKVAFDLTSSNVYMKNADHLYGIGEYKVCNKEEDQAIGNLPLKVSRALRLAENRDFLRVDIVPEGGLGTVWTGVQLDMNNWPLNATNRSTFDQIYQVFDDTVFIDGILNSHPFDKDSDGLLDQVTGTASEASDLYETVYNLFNNFCQFTRRDCLYIADPLRYIFVQGIGDVKVLNDKTKNFSQHIYWPLKNLYAAANSSYATIFANWFKTNDLFSGKFVWSPPSGWMARKMIETDTNFFPWYAPAGLTRGILQDVVDIGINPTQKQRDLLYKIGINPTVFFPTDGYIVWGQKTLQKKPSALDRINVRRLFLWLEKAVLPIARYFVFEQNTVFTRTRFKQAVAPVLDFARDNEGVYDYLIVCDERNNTPDVIDRNELIMDIYIKPVRVAEYILINFIATRTGQDFEELI